MSIGTAQNLLAEVIAYEKVIAPEVANISKKSSAHIEIMESLRQNFLRITGTDLLEPAAVWKYQYIFNAIKYELPFAIGKVNTGDKNAEKYVAGFVTLLGELNFNLGRYIAGQTTPTPPPGDPYNPPSFNPLNPVKPQNPFKPGTPAPEPTKPFYKNPVYIAIGGFTLLKAFKII